MIHEDLIWTMSLEDLLRDSTYQCQSGGRENEDIASVQNPYHLRLKMKAKPGKLFFQSDT